MRQKDQQEPFNRKPDVQSKAGVIPAPNYVFLRASWHF